MAAINPYPSLEGTSRLEINLRTELHTILYGNDTQVLPHGRILIIRHFRRDNNNQRIKCGCMKNRPLSRPQKNPDFKCRFCFGEGYLFDDNLEVGWVSRETPYPAELNEESWGVFRAASPMVFLEYHVTVFDNDLLLLPRLNDDGKLPTGALEIVEKHKIIQAQEIRSDYGRLEFFRCKIAKEHLDG